MYDGIVRLLIRFRWPGLAAILGITVFFASVLADMEMYTQFLDLFPQDHPYVEMHKKHGSRFGGAYQASVMLVVKDGTVFNTDTLAKIHRIQYAVDLIPGVDHFGIFSIASPRVTITRETSHGINTMPVMKIVPKNASEIDELKKRVFTSTVNGTLVSHDQKALLLTANFIEGRIDFTKLFDAFQAIKSKESDAGHEIFMAGEPLLYGWIYHFLPQMGKIFGITTFVILLMLFIYMRKGGLWWIPFICAVLSSIWGLGFSALLGFHFDPLIIVVPFLLSARAISHAVQWTERFVEEYKRVKNTRVAALIAGAGLFPPGLLGILTDALGLFVISFTPIPILKNLAYLGTFWAVSVVFTVLVFLPMLCATLKTVRTPSSACQEGDLLQRVLATMAGWTFGRGRYLMLCVAVLVLVASVISSTHLTYGDANPGTPILWPDSEYNAAIEQINGRFPGVDQMWVVIEGKEDGAMAFPDVVRGMEALKRHMIADPNVGFATSIADLVKSVSMLAYGNNPKMERIPRTQEEIYGLLGLYSMGAGPGDMDKWADHTFSVANVRLFLKDHKGDTLVKVIDKIKKFIEDRPDVMAHAVAKPAGGLGGILAAANEVIAVKNHQILAIVLGLIFVLCTLTYRSLLAGVIYVMSLILANFLAFAYMVYKDIGLNINTLPVVALGIGIGVDYGLYIVSRIREAYQVRPNLSEAVIRGVTSAGRAVFFTATMMTAGVVFWFLSPIRFQAEMGILLGILMIVNMLVGILVLPAIINILKPRFIMRHGI